MSSRSVIVEKRKQNNHKNTEMITGSNTERLWESEMGKQRERAWARESESESVRESESEVLNELHHGSETERGEIVLL